jgi:hypothetical protein
MREFAQLGLQKKETQMRISNLIFTLAALPALAQAAPVCVEMPETVSADVQPNFDGTLTYGSPKLLVGGKMVVIGYDRDGYDSLTGFCAFLGKKLVTATLDLGHYEACVFLTKQGTIGSFYPDCGKTQSITSIICK